MRLPLAALLVILLAAPSNAAPLAHADDTYIGVAHTGSIDSRESWTGPIPCADVITTYQITLEILEGGPSDLLLLEAPDFATAAVAIATKATPATVLATQGQSCPDFRVAGFHVETVAIYKVTARPLAA